VYKVLLCWRYLLTRYLALACIVSVMLGVATLIVVNSVMSGFSTKLKDRLHSLLSDVDIESVRYSGIEDPDEKIRRIKADPYLSSRIDAIAPMMEIFGMIQYHVGTETVMRPVRIIGIDPVSRSQIGGFSEFLQNPEKRDHPERAFEPPSNVVKWIEDQQWNDRELEQANRRRKLPPGEKPPPDLTPFVPYIPEGVVVGYAIVTMPDHTVPPGEPKQDVFLLHPGDDVHLYTVSGEQLAPVHARFLLSDYIKTEMSDYDANYVYVPLEYLQKLRGMDNRASSIQIRLKNPDDATEVVEHLQALFPEKMPFSDSRLYLIQTWQQKQGPLLGAIAVERGLLNVLLFMIVAVAGFGILAIFSMIVVEKTRDIGILKALGASNGGVMKIFLGYGLLLGVIGAVLGTVLGLVFSININEIEHFLTKLTGQEIFPRDIYYFATIPTNIQSLAVALVDLGAILIAVLASVLPALRAAMLHPVRALRYE
jgi:lipoprotein-releasing system permease protein